MAKTPAINDVESRVEAFFSSRREAVRTLAQTHAHLQEVNDSAEQERAALEERLAASLKTAQARDAQAWNAALSAGWTEQELRRLGFVEPVTKARPRRRRGAESAATRSTVSTPPTASASASASGSGAIAADPAAPATPALVSTAIS